MSVIAWDGQYLAADRQSTAGHHIHESVKVFRHKDMLIGMCGPHVYSAMIVNWVKAGCWEASFPEMKCEGDDIPLVYVIYKDGVIHRYEDNPHPILIRDKFWAAGAGGDLAMGAMAHGASAVQAVITASKFNPMCGMGVDILSFEEGDHD